MRLTRLAALALILAAPHFIHAQNTRREIIRGRVLADTTAKPVVAAEVIVTPVGTRDSRMIKSDSSGRFRIVFDSGSGDYLVHATAVGRKPYDSKVTRKAGSRDSTLDVEVRLLPLVQQLAEVKVQASRRSKPPVNDQFGAASPGSNDRFMSSVNLGADGFAAAAASIPGVTLVPGTDGSLPGFSVLGLPPSQNAVTLNGLSLGTATVPSGAFTSTRISTNSTDPTVGGFSGAMVSVNLFSGGNFTFGNATLGLDDPVLQWTDAAGRELGQRYRNTQLSLSRTGPFIRDKLTYNTSVQVGRRTNNATTLASADADALEHVGVSITSAEQLFSTLDALGIPVNRAGAPADVTVENATLLSRLDIAPNPSRTIDFTGNASWRRTTPTSLTPTASPSRGGTLTSTSGSLQFEYARYIEDFYLARTRSGFSVAASDGVPLTLLPEGRVLATSTLPDGTSGLATLQFGGLSSFPQRNHQWAWETTEEASWFVPDNKHRPKIAAGAHLDGYTNESTPNAFGTYTFNSLGDLGSGQATSFSRSLGGGTWNGQQAYLWGAASDLWRITDRFSVTMGARVEGNHIETPPEYNASLDQALGVRTDVVPSAVAVLPRAGFSLAYGHLSQKATAFGSQPTGFLSGSIGEYRSSIQTSSLGGVLTGTGLPDALRRIACVGPATPVPDWAAYAQNPAAIPSQCADGATAAQFTDTRPLVTAYAPGFDAPRAWRASLTSQPGSYFGFRLGFTANYSLNLNQPSVTDVNFQGVPRFALGPEGGRAVYADASRIDPGTGGIDPLASRISSGFSRVMALSSDMRSESKQLQMIIAPSGNGFFLTRTWSLTYTYAQVRDETRGFDGAANGDPRVASWGTSTGDIRHTIGTQVTWAVGDFGFMNLTTQFRSGAPFTPIVQGDVNGDGLSNDRAFVFDPAAVKDPVVAQAMRQLIANSPSGIRDCLTAQLGSVAGRNSCRGPWTATMSLNLGTQLRGLGLNRRGSLSLTVSNPLGAFDQILHGDNVHGWGQPAFPNATLLAVTGFDPVTQQFKYSVNPLFGDTRPARSAVRTPFGLTLSVSMPLGAPSSLQVLDDVLGPGRFRKGDKLSPAQIKQRYENVAFFDPIRVIVQAADSLLLTKDQTARLKEVNDEYTATKDTIFRSLANDLAATGDTYDPAEAILKVRAARGLGFDALERAAAKVRDILTLEQLRLVAPEVQQMLDIRGIRRLRAQDVDF